MAVEMPIPLPRWTLPDDQQGEPGDLIALSPTTTTVVIYTTARRWGSPPSFSLHLYDFTTGAPPADVPLPWQPGQLLFSPDGIWLLALPAQLAGDDMPILLGTLTLLRAPWDDPSTVALSAPPDVPWGGQLEASGRTIGGRWLNADEALVAMRWREKVDTPHTGPGGWVTRTLVLVVATTGLARVVLEREERGYHWNLERFMDEAAADLDASATAHRPDEIGIRLKLGGKQAIVERRVDDRYREWLRWEVGGHGQSCDAGRVQGVEFVALTKPPRVHQLPDADETWVYTGDANLRARAATSLGNRKAAVSVPHLGRLLDDDAPPVRAAAITALARIGDPAALALLVRAVGGLSQPDADLVVEELRTAVPLTLARVATGCLRESKQGARRGAVRMLQLLPVLPATLLLRSLLTDPDPVIRRGALLGLGQRRSLRVTPQVMARLADAEPDVAAAAWGSLVDILDGNGLLSRNDIRAAASWPDITGYARTLVASGVLDVAGQDHPAARFLHGVARALVASGRPLTDVLDGIEDVASAPAARECAIALALATAQVHRKERRVDAAESCLGQAILLVREPHEPGLLWRLWFALGECRRVRGDDRAAANRYARAVRIIDRWWHQLLDEDVLRHFFRDKAELYDRAAECALRLGHPTVALEYVERAKTRYLGDLIARRQLGPVREVTPSIRTWWEFTDTPRPTRVRDTPRSLPDNANLEIVAVSAHPLTGPAPVMPQRLASLIEAALEPTGKLAQSWGGGLDQQCDIALSTWCLVAALDDLDDAGQFREALATTHDLLVGLRDAVGGDAPGNGRVQNLLDDYREAVSLLDRLGQGRRHLRAWVLFESYSDYVSRPPADERIEAYLLFVDALVEPTAFAARGLRPLAPPRPGAPPRNPVLGRPVQERVVAFAQDMVARWDDARVPRLTFDFRMLDNGADEPPERWRIIDSDFVARVHTRWEQITRLARGKIAGVCEARQWLALQPDTALVQFAVTDQGTHTFILVSDEKPGDVRDPGARSAMEWPLHTFVNRAVTLHTLNKTLLADEESWFWAYRRLQDNDQQQRWMTQVDRTLGWLYTELLAPVRPLLQRHRVKRLVVVPHRGLHLTPLGAWWQQPPGMERRYVLDDFSVCYAPSLTLLDICAGRVTAGGHTDRLPLAIDPTEDLHLSRVEVAWVPNAAGVRGEPLLGPHATRDRWRTTVAAAQAAHYSGHGQYVWEDPLRSHLVLADGPLEAGGLFSEPVPLWAVRLISLSGCETGMPDPADLADEYVSVAAGFMFLGASTVLSTLWVANVFASAILFRDWYAALRTGARPSDALAEAQRRLRDMRARDLIRILKKTLREARRVQDEKMLDEVRELITDLETKGGAFGHRRPFAHPVFWAGFTLNGIDFTPRFG